MTQPNQKPKAGIFIVPPKFLIGTVVACLTLAGFLVPRKEELVQRLMEDGRHERARALAVQEVSPQESAAPSAQQQPSLLKQLADSLTPSDGQTGEVANLIYAIGDPEACRQLVRELGNTVPAAQLEKAYLAMGQSALAGAKPALAAEIYQEGKSLGLNSEPLLVRLVQTCRWTNQPQAALDALLEFQQHGPLPASLADMPVELYRELNQPDKALELLMQEWEEQAANGEVAESLVEEATEVAGQAGQIGKVLPLVRAYIDKLPASQATLEALATGEVKPDPTWLKFTKLTAQQCEWGGEPLEAFRFYERLAVTGDHQALERMLELNPGLNRDEELLAVLKAVVPIPEKPELTLVLARMLADAGEADLANHHFENWLADHPDDLAVMIDQAALAEENSQQDQALAIYQKGLVLAPDNLAIKKAIASLRIARNEFEAAFQFYDQLPEQDHDAATLENYALVAESLAEYRALNHALMERQHRLKKPVTQDFLELARSYAVIGDQDMVISTYEDGLKRIPSSHILRIELANALRMQERYDEALALLARPELKQDMHAMQLYIEVACMKEDYVGALTFLGRGFENKFAFGPEVRLDLGHIYFNNGYESEADALYSSVPDEPALWPLLANARYKAGNFASAEIFQRKYLDSLQIPDASGWMLMGDIYQAEGKTTDADAAYARSLSQIEARLAGSAADAPSSAALKALESSPSKPTPLQ